MREWQKKTNFGPDFGLFWPKFGPPKLFLWVLPLVDVIHCCKLSLYSISRKTYEPNLIRKQKKLVSGLIFAPLAQIWSTNFFCVDFASTRLLDV